MNSITVIATLTFKKAIREKIFYSLLSFALILIVFSMALGNITYGQPVKIIKDFGLGAISLVGVLIAVFVGINSIYKEIESKTIYLILAKPVSRLNFLIGKYLGISLVLLCEVIFMTTSIFLLLKFVYGESLPWYMCYAILTIWIEIQLILAVALLFSTFSTPFLSGMFTLGVFAIGHLTNDFRMLVEGSQNERIKALSSAVYYIFPNLENLNYSTQVVHALEIDMTLYFKSIAYGAVYSCLMLAIAVLIFSNRDIK